MAEIGKYKLTDALHLPRREVDGDKGGRPVADSRDRRRADP
jgi:hypothetical protein